MEQSVEGAPPFLQEDACRCIPVYDLNSHQPPASIQTTIEPQREEYDASVGNQMKGELRGLGRGGSASPESMTGLHHPVKDSLDGGGSSFALA